MTHFKLSIAFILFSLLFVFQQCTNGTGVSGTWNSEHIPQDLKLEIKKQNDKLFMAIHNKDYSAFKKLTADVLIKKEGETRLKSLFDQLCGIVKGSDYKVMDEFYTKTTKNAGNVVTGGSGDHAYQLSYKALNNEMYATLLLPEGLHNELLLTLIYGKYGNEWKINIFHGGQYSMFGKTAPDYFNIAKESYKKQNFIDALVQVAVANACMKPGDVYFNYNSEKEIVAFQKKLIEEVNKQYSFPILLSKIKTKPELFSITPQIMSDGYFPLVAYVTKVDLADTVALKLEYEQVAKETGLLFKGINENKKYVLYKAYNELPDGKKLVNTYGFVYEVK